MKHFRILEIKKKNKKTYIVQYLKPIIFNLYVWKKLNNKSYSKYDEALLDVKKYIKQDDYDNSEYGYHYIDAYKIFKYKDTQEIKSDSIKLKSEVIKNKSSKINKSVYIPKR